MANPYAQFENKSSSPYSQFDEEDKNPYAQFGKETTSTLEDIGIGWKDVGKTMLDANIIAEAGMRKLGEYHPLTALFTDADKNAAALAEDVRKADELKASMEEYWTPKDKEQTFGGKVIGTLGSIPGQLLAMPFSPAQTGKEAIDIGETPERAAEMALIDTGGNMIGLALPGALGTGLVTKALTGAGIGAAQDYATRTALSDIAQTEEGKKRFAPTAESTALAGIVGGALGGITPSTHGGKARERAPEIEAEVPPSDASRDATKITEDYITQANKDIDRADYKIKQIERDLAETTHETPEQAAQYKQAKIEELQQHAQEIAELKKGIEQAEINLGRREPAPISPREEIPSSRPPRPEEDYVAPETEAIPPEEAMNANWFDQLPPDEGTGLSMEAIDLQPIEHLDTAEFTDYSQIPTKELEDHISTLDPTTPEGRTQFEVIAQELASRVPERQRGMVINGGSEHIRSLVKDWAQKLGLDKEDVQVNLDYTHGENIIGTQIGSATVHPSDVGEINVKSAEALERSIESNPNARRWMKGLSKESEAKFREAWTAAHELGHIMLAKLLQNKLYSDSLGLGRVLKDYDAYMAKHQERGTLEIARAEGNLFARSKNRDYYLAFPEYFAQRVAKELTMGKSAPKKDAISRFVHDMREMFTALMSHAKMPWFRNNFVDNFIQDIISQNKQSLEETGQTLWEVDSTTVSMYEAWNWQFDHLMPKAESRTLSGMEDVAAKSGIRAAVHHIQNAEQVITAQQFVPDINPMGSKGVGKFTSGLVNKAGNWLFGIQQKAQLYKNSPLVKYTSDVILNGLHTQTMRQMELLAGKADRAAWDGKNKIGISLKRIQNDDAPSVVFDKSSNEDFYAVHKILEKGIGKYSYEESLAMFGGTLTEKQKTLYNTTVKMYARMYEMASGVEKSLGKKGIVPNMKGWYPAIRKGEFTVNFRIEGLKRVGGRDEMGRALMTDLVHSQSFRTEGEARAFIEHFEKQSPEFKGKLQHGGVEKVGDPEMINSIADFHRAYQEQRAKLESELAGDPALAPKWFREEIGKAGGDPQKILDARMQKMVDMYIARGGTLGGHHRLRTNVSGAMGSEMFTTSHDAGKAFRDANFKAVDEYTNMMMKMEIQEKVDLLLSKEELKQSHPNTMEVVQLMRDYALNEVKSPMEMKSFKASVDAVWEQLWAGTAVKKMKVFGAEKYMDAPVVDLAMSKFGHFFYIHALMSRPAFWAAQGVQFLWAGRTMVKDGVGPIGAMTHAGKGFWQVLRPDKEFMDAIFHVSQTSHTFSPQFIQELNKHGIGDFMKEGGKGKLLFDLVTGEKQATMADTFSRLMTFGMVYEHYKSKGLKGEELANEAAKATDENMVQYSRQYKAPAFQKLGVVGDLVAPLQTFSQAALGNLVADVGDILQAPGGKAKLKASLPFMATVAITTLMAGAIGAPLVAEYEALRLLINHLSNRLGGGDLLPSVVDAVISGDNTFANRTLSHGLISSSTMAATEGAGVDVAASNRWQPIWGGMMLGQKTFMESLPVVNFWLDRAGDVKDVLSHAAGISELSDAGRRKAALGIVPGMYKGLIDDLLFGARDREMVPDTKGRATVPQTDTERLAKYLGTSTITSSTEKLRERRTKEEEMRDQSKIDQQFELLADAVQKGDKTRAAQISRDLAEKYQIDQDQQVSRLEGIMFKRTVPSGMKQFVGKTGTSSTQQMKRAQHWQDTYGDLPLEND